MKNFIKDWSGKETNWKHAEQGVYRREDGKGAVIQFGSHDWDAHADVGEGMQNIGVGRSGAEARSLVDDVLLKGKNPPPPEMTPGTFLEQVTEKIRRAGLSSSIIIRARQIRGAEGVELGTGKTFSVAIIINEWGMKEGQRSYQVFSGSRSREPV